jgi:hypothetical protein
VIQEHDIVALTADRPPDQLRRGDVGCVVHCYAGGAAYEVEFVDERGRTRCVITVPADHLMRLNFLSLSA